jgi:putative ABC transport system permease protein
MYLAMVALLGVVAVLIGLPAGIAFGRGFVGLTAGLLNLRIESFELPWWLFAASIGLGVGAPVLAAFVPIWLAARRTVREAIADHGAATTSKSSGRLFAWMSTIPMPDAAISLASRNMFRRRGRLLLTSSLLAGSGAMFLTAMNLKAAWERNVAIAVGDSRYDAEIRLQNPAPSDRIAALVSGMPGVAEFESWSSVAAAAARDSGPLITQQYPDGGHGGFVLREAPSGTTLIAHTMTSGRWLVPSDTNGVVLNNLAQALAFRRARVGDSIALDVADRRVLFRVVGITRELLTPGAAYVTPDAFARATHREQQTNAFRISVTAGTEPNAVTSAIAHRLEHEQIGVKTIISSARFAAAQGGHIYILVYALGFIASIMSLVGFLGLASSLGTSVVERTREFGVMRALGARSSAVMRMVLAEGVMTAALSWLAAWILASPLSNAVGSVLGAIASNDLVLRRTPTALLLWLVIVLVGATAVSVLPARRAARLTVRETLSHI